MDHSKEHNGQMTFYEHWWFLALPMIGILAAIALPVFSELHRSQISKESNMSGFFSRDSGSVYWCVLSKPKTNQIQFVLLLPVTTTIESGGNSWTGHSDDYCNLQVKSTTHQWRIVNDLDWKAGVHTVQLQDLTANTTGTLTVDNGRFWQLDDTGGAKRLEAIDPGTMAQIFGQVKTNEAKMAMTRANAGNQ